MILQNAYMYIFQKGLIRYFILYKAKIFAQWVQRIEIWYSDTIVHILPAFGCLGDSAWNCIPTIYSVVKGVCVCEVAPETTSEVEKLRLEQKRQSQDQGLNVGIQFQANSLSSQIREGRFFCILTPLILGGGRLFRDSSNSLLFIYLKFCYIDIT